MPKKRRLIVIVKQKEFDEAAWKRLLVAYAYALHFKRQREARLAAKRNGGTA